MDAPFWHQKWAVNDIGFHLSEANPSLTKHFGRLSLAPGARIFVPLCGKTLDIGWLLSRRYRIAGAELSEKAIGELFAQLALEPNVSRRGPIKHYSAAHIDIYAGDIFDLTREMLGAIDAVYDRAALIALPEATRRRYSAHLMALTDQARQLLLCCEYDQTLMEGPPFSVTAEEIERHYAGSYEVTLIDRFEIPGGIKGMAPATENVWQLAPRPALEA